MWKRGLLLVLIIFGSRAAAGELESGIIAHAMGKYDTAFEVLLPLAVGSAQPIAQYYVGYMYEMGQGINQDYKNAASWYRKAAERGIAQAQYRLGELYANGKGAPLDYEYAYAWKSVAASQGHKQAQASLQTTKDQLSPTELEQAEELSEQFTQRYAPKSDSANSQHP
ncbi:MAG: tetratricopeptide repeat protein [Gammaproteobacteria bacterium]